MKTESPHQEAQLLETHLGPLVRGTAAYLDDLPEPENLLHAVIVGSPQARAKILAIDATRAKQMPGVVGVLTADDLGVERYWGAVERDCEILASSEVYAAGQPIALVVARSQAQARAAARNVEISLQPKPAIASLAQAIDAVSYYEGEDQVCRGDAASSIEAARFVLQGKQFSGAQEHLYLETQACIASSDQDGLVTVASSTQHPRGVQHAVARALGVSENAVKVVTRRIGGGFGGKETQAEIFAILAALASKTFGRAVKLRLNREDDMRMTGKRHAFSSSYRVGFDALGKICGIEVELVADAGYYLDLSRAVLSRALFHLDNAYFLEHCTFRGKLARTNLPASTAFRGFGGPQGMFVIETIIEAIAEHLGIAPQIVRERNFYRAHPHKLAMQSRQSTPYGQRIDDFELPKLWQRLLQTSDFSRRQQEIAADNLKSPFRKRALAITPVKFGISFTTTFLNQAGALVLIYPDGSVQVNHGGVEMGQGLHAKIQQIASSSLGVPLSSVRVMQTATDKVPNASATAASASTDLNGAAVEQACHRLRSRLFEFLAKRWNVPADCVTLVDGVAGNRQSDAVHMSFAELAMLAHRARIELFATGFFATPDIHFENGTGRPFAYFACGAAVSEVEVDVLTGEHRLLRVDICHDVGRSLVPAIDTGQIVGGFAQGLGWVAMEEVRYDAQGLLQSAWLSRYQVPCISDMPEDFRVELYQGEHSPALFGSKAVGEPPFMLALSVWSAIRAAINAVEGSGCFSLPIPCTPPTVLEAIVQRRGRSCGRGRGDAAVAKGNV